MIEEVGGREEYVVPWLKHRQHREHEGLIRTGGDQQFRVRVNLPACDLRQPRAYRLPQLRNAGVLGVAVNARVVKSVRGANRGFGRRGESRRRLGEADDVVARRAKRGDAGVQRVDNRRCEPATNVWKGGYCFTSRRRRYVPAASGSDSIRIRSAPL